MRIAMFGAGGVGGYFGARLTAAGNDVTFIARGRHLAAMQADGLKVSSIKGDLTLRPVQATADPGSVGPVETVFVAVKTWQLPEVIAAMGPLVGSETTVVPLLNGVEAADELAAAFGAEAVLKGLCKILSQVEAPGHIRHLGAEPYIALGEPDGRPSKRTQRLVEVLREADIKAAVPDDIDAALWEKFAFVVSVGGVGAVTRAPIGQVRSDPETRRLLRGAIEEIAAVAAGRGVTLDSQVVERSMTFIDGLPEAGSASLQRDLAAGRPSELEAWNGAVVRLGEAAGIPTPIHGFIHTALRLSELRARSRIEFAVPGEEADPFRARFLADVAARFEWAKRVADRALEQLSDADFFRTLDAGANSVATLVKHMAGNHRSRWSGFLESDGEKPDRHRDSEFVLEGETREALTRAWESGWAVLFESIRALSASDLDRTVTIRSEPHTVERALSRSLAHASYHSGQIVLLAKHFLGSDWRTLSIPVGGSEAWNRDMRARFD